MDIYHYHENTKQLNDEITWDIKNQTCHICHINVWNARNITYIIPSIYKGVNHVQNKSLKNSKTQELRYT